MTLSPEELQRALDQCSADPIHIPGHVQDFGVLVAIDRICTQITSISENCMDLFGRAGTEIVGQSPDILFTEQQLHSFRNVLSHSTIKTQREVLPPKVVRGRSCHMSIHMASDQAIVEIVPEPLQGHDHGLALSQAQTFLSTPINDGDLVPFFHEATERLRALSGFDRVKFYQFLPDGAGEVVAEARHADVDSFLGLRFPASDIPQIARTLYAQTPVRVIHDVQGSDSQMIGLPGAGPLDMSLAVLRGKDPVHRQYLENMGVAATMTVPVVVDGVLWGLFAAHHMTPKTVDPNVLVAAELAGKVISLRVQHVLESRRKQAHTTCFGIANRLFVVDDSKLAVDQYWTAVKDELAAMVGCDGVVMMLGQQVMSQGDVPPMDACRAIPDLFATTVDTIVSLNTLPTARPDVDWGDTAGVLALRVAGQRDVTLAFCRNLVERSVRWAGQPEKEVTVQDGVPRLSPRASFSTYIESSREQSKEWTAVDIEIARALYDALYQVLETQDEMRDNRHRMGLMVHELNHRVRNILALVQSLSSQSRQGSTSIDGYAASLESRIVALAGAHNLMTRADMRGVLLSELVLLELRPFAGELGRITVEGPDTVLRPDAASVFALVIHELTSNAVKYGALSTATGRLMVTWRVTEDTLDLLWVESGGPPVADPTRSGVGRTIVEESLRYEFGGTSSLQFLPAGVEARFAVPTDVIVDVDIVPRPSKGGAVTDGKVGQAVPRGRALVVEDNFVVSMQSKAMMHDLGFAQVDAAASVSDALQALDAQEYDFCLLDMNLQGALCTPIAMRLKKDGIPFVFATGYGSDAFHLVQGISAPWVVKPIETEVLRAILDTGVKPMS
ncbi:HWE histidine kinase domain-containing protein [uncultured Tateyamaria sp.]|uniref:HWE histidine kinase domain-containing protein n=1 Tax=uncultured Tateyamaria sp. TaxID=455651 RepID=UPI00260F7F64|nr:HWE histidine kinase domain-containing protein [uncultured Tateyamaria sp.]